MLHSLHIVNMSEINDASQARFLFQERHCCVQRRWVEHCTSYIGDVYDLMRLKLVFDVKRTNLHRPYVIAHKVMSLWLTAVVCRKGRRWTFQRKVNARMTPCACAGWCESKHFVHVRRTFSPDEAHLSWKELSFGAMNAHTKIKRTEVSSFLGQTS